MTEQPRRKRDVFGDVSSRRSNGALLFDLRTLGANEQSVIQNYRSRHDSNIAQAVKQAYHAAVNLKREYEAHTRRINFRGREDADKLVRWIERFKSMGDVIADHDKIHTNLPWAGICIILDNAVTTKFEIAGLLSGLNVALYTACRLQAYLEYLCGLTISDTSAALGVTLVQSFAPILRFVGDTIRYCQEAPPTTQEWNLPWGAPNLDKFEASCKKWMARVEIDTNSCESNVIYPAEELNKTLSELEKIQGIQSSPAASQQIDDLTRLQVQAVEGATYNSSQQAASSTCLEGTRSNLLKKIIDWANDVGTKRLFWLCGNAGTGKSTISRTVAKQFDQQGILGASFFFRRGEDDRSSAQRFFQTIAIQLAQTIPGLRWPVVDALDEDRLLCEKPLSVQSEKLLLQPVQNLPQSWTRSRVRVIVVDALDECHHINEVRSLVTQLVHVATMTSGRLRIFVTSRVRLPEILGFDTLLAGQYNDFILESLEASTIEHDVRAYFVQRLRQIRDEAVLEQQRPRQIPDETVLEQPFGDMPIDWPGEEDIEKLVQLAVPLFTVASIICRFISQSDPQERLRSILEQQQPMSLPGLSKIYLQILDRAIGREDESYETTTARFRKVVGPIVLLASPLSVRSLGNLLDISASDVSEIVQRLYSVLDVPADPNAPIRLIHLSFRDFLLDSGDFSVYRINETETHRRLLAQCLRLLRQPGTLKKDICGVKLPDVQRAGISEARVASSIADDVAYACSYWVYHLELGGDQTWDGGPVHDFLIEHFLHWLEALSWLGQISKAIPYIEQLQSSVDVDRGRKLTNLLENVRRLVLRIQTIVDEAPLQIYTSQLVALQSVGTPFSDSGYASASIRAKTEAGLNDGVGFTHSDDMVQDSTENADNVEGVSQEDEDDRVTIVSDAATLRISQNVRVEAINLFITDVCQELASTDSSFAPSDDAHAASLMEAVGCFASLLLHSARPGPEQDAAVFFRQQRRRVADAYLRTFESDALTREDDNELLSSLHDLAKLAPVEGIEEKLARMHDVSATGDEGDHSAEWFDDVQFPEGMTIEEDTALDWVENFDSYITSVRPFVKNSFAFRWLVGKVQTIQSLTNSSGTQNAFPTRNGAVDFASTKFMVQWDPVKFLTRQYHRGIKQRLGDVITLTEVAGNIQAATCEQYISQTWSYTGIHTLSTLQRSIDTAFRKGTGCKTSTDQLDLLRSKVELTICIDKLPWGDINFRMIDGMLEVSASAPRVILSEIEEQLCWLGAACRASSHATCGSYITATVVNRQSGLVNVEFSERVPDESTCWEDTKTNCWKYLFRNPTIAVGFPIRAREKEQAGLEIPLGMMIGLGCVDMVTVFDGQLMIKGFSTLMVPVGRLSTSILWHLYGDREQQEVLYDVGFDDRLFPSRAAVNFVDLWHARHFVGWVPSAALRTGAANIEYCKIRYPKAPLSGPGCSLNAVTISGGKFISAGASFSRGHKDESIGLHPVGLYRQKLYASRSNYVVFFDDAERRGWLVDGPNAILHLLRAQLKGEAFEGNEHFKDDAFRYANPSPSAALETLLLNQHLEVDRSQTSTQEMIWDDVDNCKREDKTTVKIWTVEDLVRQILDSLAQMRTQQNKVKELYLRTMMRDKLEGWSAKEIIAAETHLEPRVITLESSGRGWMDFITSIGAVALIGRGFGDLIVPSAYTWGPCANWQRVPVGMDYLAATVHTLRAICEKYGDEDATPLRLADNIYWHQAHHLFDRCSCTLSDSSCDRVQVLLPRIRVGPTKKPEQLTNEAYSSGAVIFGRSKRLQFRWPKKGDPVGFEDSPDDEST